MIRTFFGFFFVIFLLTETKSQDAFYRHYTGSVGANIQIVVDLVKSGEKLSGYYYYFFDEKSGDTSWTHYGKSMPIYGTITDNQFEFSEFDPDVKGAVFKGFIENDSITGTWNSADGKKKLPIGLKQNYPQGSLPFTAYFMNRTGPLFEQKLNPKASIEVSLLVPGDYSPSIVADSVRNDIYDHFFDVTIPSSDPAILLDSMKELYFRNYRKSNADIYQEGAASFDWQKIKEVRVLHNEKEILSLEFHDYGYTGGAHGLSISSFQVFDLKDGHKIGLDEIFRADFRNDLRDIINSVARKKYHLERNTPMTEAGFFVQYIDPTGNFYITKDGIGFYYNQYEIAPFALGPIEIFVNYNDLLRILNAQSPVYRIISVN